VRPTWAEVDRSAIAHNVSQLAALAAPAELCAVVKADGYGHGAVEVSRAALAAGATWLAVALVEEGVVLREAGIEAPILLLSEAPADAVPAAVAAGLRPTAYSRRGVADLAAAARAAGAAPVRVHLKVDTGMHRVGCPPSEVVALADAVAAEPSLRLDAVWTHLAVADEPGHPFTAEQLSRFDSVVAACDEAGHHPNLRHAANSAGAIEQPAARYDLVRCGISVYGIAPSAALAGRVDLRPAMAIKSQVTQVKTVAAGDGISYGLRHRFDKDSAVATVPIGYADGLPRRLSAVGGEVLIGGCRRRIAGTVTMDMITVDCGDDATVAPGDEVVLIGEQGGERIGAEDWADRLDTIAYEVVAGVGPRVPRRVVGPGTTA
jgi:alanine racemase